MTVSPWTVLFEIAGAVEVDTLDLPPVVSVMRLPSRTLAY